MALKMKGQFIKNRQGKQHWEKNMTEFKRGIYNWKKSRERDRE